MILAVKCEEEGGTGYVLWHWGRHQKVEGQEGDERPLEVMTLPLSKLLA